jgi:prepilin-type N-terminal cleavage/methylation domain-containing protein
VEKDFMNVQKNNEKGFTIIEVVLVLAIAALIFLMVFIALPALQRNQRDTARKADVSSIASGVVSFTSNNRGTFPTTGTIVEYAKDISKNTTSVTVANTLTGSINAAPVAGVVTVYPKAKCGGNATPANAPLVLGSGSQFVVVTKLESGAGQYFCLDS